jgi:hypothetical protein
MRFGWRYQRQTDLVLVRRWESLDYLRRGMIHQINADGCV